MDLVLIGSNSSYPAVEDTKVEAAALGAAVADVALWVSVAAEPTVGNVLKLNAPALPDAITKPKNTT